MRRAISWRTGLLPSPTTATFSPGAKKTSRQQWALRV